MAIYNVDNTSAIGKPVRVFDANGMELHQCLEVDTITGRVLQFVVKDGSLVENAEGDLERQEEYYPAPLLVVPRTKSSPPVGPTTYIQTVPIEKRSKGIAVPRPSESSSTEWGNYE